MDSTIFIFNIYNSFIILILKISNCFSISFIKGETSSLLLLNIDIISGRYLLFSYFGG